MGNYTLSLKNVSMTGFHLRIGTVVLYRLTDKRGFLLSYDMGRFKKNVIKLKSSGQASYWQCPSDGDQLA